MISLSRRHFLTLGPGLLTTGGFASSAERAVLRLRSDSADFAELGLTRQVQPWEDGRRAPQSETHFEWWYFDCLLDNGTIAVAWLGDNWSYGTRSRAVNLELTRPNEPTRKAHRKFVEPGEFSRDRCDVRIGPHSFRGNLDTYSLRLDAGQLGGMGCDLKLVRSVPSFRPATGFMSSEEDYFAWLVAVPGGTVSGSVTIDGETFGVAGAGYHDHNWGNVSPARLFRSWWWGRATVGDHTIVFAQNLVRDELGGSALPTLFIGSAGRTEIEAFGAAVSFSEGAPGSHPDPAHPAPISSSVELTAGNATLAARPMRLLASVEVGGVSASNQSDAAAQRSWYTRFVSEVSLALPGASPQAGQGILEYFEFE